MSDTISISIDTEFQNLIPPLSAKEFALLEADIIERGCKQPIELWGDVIVDGHHRYGICQKHGLQFKTEQVAGLDTRADVVVWMVRNQFGRRNITPFVRGELALKMKSAYAAKAKQRQGKRADLNDLPENLPESGDTRDQLAKQAGMSGRQLDKIEKILANGIPKLIDNAKTGKLSIHMASQISKLTEKWQGYALYDVEYTDYAHKDYIELTSLMESLGVIVHPNRMGLTLPDDLPFEKWQEVFLKVVAQAKRSQEFDDA